MQDPPAGYAGPRTLREFLTTLEKEPGGNCHGYAFTYRSANTDILSWVVERALGGPPGCSRVWFQDNIWSKLGCESDAFIAEGTYIMFGLYQRLQY